MAELELEPQEKRKRSREYATLVLVGFFFLLLTWAEFKLFGMSKSLPFVHSIFFFGLVNFNIILFLLMVFLIFRNIVKNFSERQGGMIGSTLKGKLIAAFVGFSFVPTALMFLVSVFYINSSFDKWFSEKTAGVLKSALEVTNENYLSSKKRNYHFAEEIAKELETVNPAGVEAHLRQYRSWFALDAVEYYRGLFGEPIVATSKDDMIPGLPNVALEFRKKGVLEQLNDSMVHPFGHGDLIRVIVPAKLSDGSRGAIVVSSYVPLSLVSRMVDITTAYDEFRNKDPLAYPLKSIYLVILVLMTLLILLAATWFGFYLAKQLSIPLVELATATKKVARGYYPTVKKTTGSPEINQLVSNFNKMTRHLERSERAVKKANKNLHKTLQQLDEHSKYVEVVLANVSTGVISVDNKGIITTINRHAADLLGIKEKNYVGQPVKKVLNPEHYNIFNDLLRSMKIHNAETIKKEISINVKGSPVPVQMNLSVLYDDKGKEHGKVMVMDDLTMVLNAQRAAAWTEVARRIAHEIKNPLTPIKLSAQRLQRKFGDDFEDPAFNECVTMITQQVDDLKVLVNEFSRFARLPKSKPVVSDLHKVIEESLILFREAHKNVNFELALDSELPPFLFDPDQVKRVITNLLDNAVAALKERARSKVTVKTSYDERLKIVSLSVSDNGPGIPKAMLDRIFEPYMTTKEHGTGLGLAIVKRAVEDHNGYIRAFANEPSGTKIVIELPVVSGEASKEYLIRNHPRNEESLS